jgi:type II secretory pathway pseudopilin PulG
MTLMSKYLKYTTLERVLDVPPRCGVLRPSGQKGFTLVEVIVAGLILIFLVAALLHYHGSSSAAKNQEHYLKAVQVARAELDRLRAFYDLQSGVSEFDQTGPPPADVFLFKFNGTGTLDLPSPTFHVYYGDHGYGTVLFQSIGNNNTVKNYPGYYSSAFPLADAGVTDYRTFVYFTNDGNTVTDNNAAQGKVDASIVVIDDMGAPPSTVGNEARDDLIGNIGWWVEDIASAGVTVAKKVTLALQFWYPGQEWTSVDPEVIVLKTTLVKP